MKLAAREARRFCRAPDAGLCGALLFGPDAGEIAVHRADLVAALTAGDPMRLTRLEPDTVRRDPAALEEALKARGFFADRGVVLVEGAKDGLAEILRPLLPGLTAEDQFLLVTATGLGPRSALRTLFEGAKALAAGGLYPDLPGQAEIASRLAAADGPREIAADAADRLAEVAAELDPGSFRQFLATLALHSRGEARLEAAAVTALAPASAGGSLDALVAAVAGGRPDRVGPLLARLAAGGSQPGAALSAASRHIRRLMAFAAAPDGPRAALDRARPPVRGPRRDTLLAELSTWTPDRLEIALRLLFDAERRLRSTGTRPDAAIVERTLLRVAMTARARGR